MSEIESANEELEEFFVEDPHTTPPDCPGSIPYISDYSQIVCFGSGGEGEPYCFDYRENRNKPRIIYWADTYWQLVAPDFETLLRLFEPGGD